MTSWTTRWAEACIGSGRISLWIHWSESTSRIRLFEAQYACESTWWIQDFFDSISLKRCAEISFRPMRGTTIVDLAGGTGDVTFRIVNKLKAQPSTLTTGAIDTRVVVCDINAEMLAEGRRRAAVNSVAADGISVEWVRGDAEALPFPDGYAQTGHDA